MRNSRAGTLLTVAVILASQVAWAQAAWSQTAGTMSDTGARSGNDIGTGNSLPRSDKASHTNASNSPAHYAPNLPSPPLGDNATPRDYLIAARNSLAAGKTGMAQQSLEMAQTRLLDRSIAPSQVKDPSPDPRVKRIEDARQALGNGQTALAMRIIDTALAP